MTSSVTDAAVEVAYRKGHSDGRYSGSVDYEDADWSEYKASLLSEIAALTPPPASELVTVSPIYSSPSHICLVIDDYVTREQAEAREADLLRQLAEAENDTMAAEAQLRLVQSDRDAWKLRGDNHWETLRSIRQMARDGDCERESWSGPLDHEEIAAAIRGLKEQP